MSENSIFSLVGQAPVVLGQTHRFSPGPLYGSALNLDSSVDVYAFVRFNNGFTPAELIQQYMSGWTVKEDHRRHSKWHGKNATWFDVLTNKISVDRSSVGNALYLVLNLATTGGPTTVKNFANIDDWAMAQQQPQQRQIQQSSQPAPMDAQALYQLQLQKQMAQMQQQIPQQQTAIGLGITQAQYPGALQNMQGMGMQNIQGMGMNMQGMGQNIQGVGMQNMQGMGMQNIQGMGQNIHPQMMMGMIQPQQMQGSSPMLMQNMMSNQMMNPNSQMMQGANSMMQMNQSPNQLNTNQMQQNMLRNQMNQSTGQFNANQMQQMNQNMNGF
jgi:hypothetical protein